MKEVATVGVVHDGKLLMGQRRDNSRWTNPGGHMENGEDPEAGALRELYEEAGITPKKIKHLATEKVTTPTGKKLIVHAFKATVGDSTTTSQKDPDKEVKRWRWISIVKGLPEEIMSNLHSPKNVLLKALGLQKEAGRAKPHIKSYYEGVINAPKLTTKGVVTEFGQMTRKAILPAIALAGYDKYQKEKRKRRRAETAAKKAAMTKTAFWDGFSKTAKDAIKGGLADNKTDSDFNKDQLRKGRKVEKEHTFDGIIANEIAKDHLVEDPQYYDHLKAMEDYYSDFRS